MVAEILAQEEHQNLSTAKNLGCLVVKICSVDQDKKNQRNFTISSASKRNGSSVEILAEVALSLDGTGLPDDESRYADECGQSPDGDDHHGHTERRALGGVL